MKQLLSDPINIFMSLAVVYLLSFIGVALLCSWYAVQHFSTLTAVAKPDSDSE